MPIGEFRLNGYANEVVSIPGHLEQEVCRVHGDAGTAWLAELPAIVVHLVARWDLELGPPIKHFGATYLAMTRNKAGAQLVLKVGVSQRELETETEALRIYQGRGAVRCIDGDPECGALLLECLQPGTKLTELSDNKEASRLAAGVMQRLQTPVPEAHSLPDYAEQIDGRFTRTLPLWCAAPDRTRGGGGSCPAVGWGSGSIRADSLPRIGRDGTGRPLGMS